MNESKDGIVETPTMALSLLAGSMLLACVSLASAADSFVLLDLPGTGTDPEKIEYPHVIEHGERLMITFSRNKKQIELLGVPLEAVESLRAKSVNRR